MEYFSPRYAKKIFWDKILIFEVQNPLSFAETFRFTKSKMHIFLEGKSDKKNLNGKKSRIWSEMKYINIHKENGNLHALF